MEMKKLLILFVVCSSIFTGINRLQAYEPLPGCYDDSYSVVSNCCEDQCDGNDRYYGCFIWETGEDWSFPGIFRYHCQCFYNACTFACVDDGGNTSCSSNCHGSSQPGDTDYCDSSCPCEDEEGDCDNDLDCESGLTCEDNYIGGCFGYNWGTDVCLSYSIACVDDTDCDDGDSQTNDLCHFPCQDSAYCTNNIVCQSNCFPSEANSCTDSLTYQTCEEVSSNCYQWVQYSCSGSDTCVDGECCYHQCNIGQIGCYNDSLRWYCGENDSDPCREMIGELCSSNQICQAGTCLCNNECIPGTNECISSTQYRSCNIDSQGCYYWGYINCSSGENCVNDTCATCNECSPGSTGCGTSNQKWTCEDSNNDGCYEKSYQTCPIHQICQSGNCECNNSCVIGDIGCSSSGEMRWECITDSNGCNIPGYWTCPLNTSCSNGICESTCSNECNSGTSGCDSSSQRWYCGENDSDPCLDIVHQSCGINSFCLNGSCQEQPTISIINPTGGETFNWGDNVSINWNHSGSINSGVDIQISCDGGNTWNEIITGTINDGQQNWLAGSYNSQNCQIKIIGYYADGYVLDISNAFSIANNHDHKVCFDNDVYWADYLNNVTDLYNDCGDGSVSEWDEYECQSNVLYKRHHESEGYCYAFNFTCSSLYTISGPIFVQNCSSSNSVPISMPECSNDGINLVQEYTDFVGYCDAVSQNCDNQASNSYFVNISDCSLVGGQVADIGVTICNQSQTAVIQEYGIQTGYCNSSTNNCDTQVVSSGFNLVQNCQGNEICLGGIGGINAQCVDASLPDPYHYVVAKDFTRYVYDTCKDESESFWGALSNTFLAEYFYRGFPARFTLAIDSYGLGINEQDAITSVEWRDLQTNQIISSDFNGPAVMIGCDKLYGHYEYQVTIDYAMGDTVSDIASIDILSFFDSFSLTYAELDSTSNQTGRHHLRYQLGSYSSQTFDLQLAQPGDISCVFANPNDQIELVVFADNQTPYICKPDNDFITIPAGEWRAHLVSGDVYHGRVDIYSDYNLASSQLATIAYRSERLVNGIFSGVCQGLASDYICIGGDKQITIVAEKLDWVLPASDIVSILQASNNIGYLAKNSNLIFSAYGRDQIEPYLEAVIGDAIQAAPGIVLGIVFVVGPKVQRLILNEISLPSKAYVQAQGSVKHLRMLHAERLMNIKHIEIGTQAVADISELNSLALSLERSSQKKIAIGYRDTDARFLGSVARMDEDYKAFYQKVVDDDMYLADIQVAGQYNLVNDKAAADNLLDELIKSDFVEENFVDLSVEKFNYAQSLGRFLTERFLERDGIRTAKVLSLDEFGQKVVVTKNSATNSFWPIRDINDLALVSGNPSLNSNQRLHNMGWLVEDQVTGDILSIQSRWGYSVEEAMVATQKDYAILKWLYPDRKINSGFVTGFKGTNAVVGDYQNSLVILTESEVSVEFFDPSALMNFQIIMGVGPEIHVTQSYPESIIISGNQKIKSMECTATEGLDIRNIQSRPDGKFEFKLFVSYDTAEGEISCTAWNYDGLTAVTSALIIADGANRFNISIEGPSFVKKYQDVEFRITATQPIKRIFCQTSTKPENDDWFNCGGLERVDAKNYRLTFNMAHELLWIKCEAENEAGETDTDIKSVMNSSWGCWCNSGGKPQNVIFYILFFGGILLLLKRKRQLKK